MGRLQTAEVEEITPDLLNAAVKLAGSSDHSARMAAGRVLGHYGTAEQVPAMLKLLAWSQFGMHSEILEALVRLKDSRAIPALVNLIARGSHDSESFVRALRSFGSAAEPAALGLFKERHAQTRRLACVLLGDVGSSKSVDVLREQVADPDEQVAQAAAQALRAIQQRESDAELK